MALWAFAAEAEPCGNPVLTAITNPAGAGQTYCQSSFGWSSTWFPTTGGVTDYGSSLALDVLSGNDAPGMIFDAPSGTPYTVNTDPNLTGITTNYNTFTPLLDANTTPARNR